MKLHIKYFLSIIAPELYDLWEDICLRPNPTLGDKFLYEGNVIEFTGVDYDAAFENGVAFYYLFINRETNERIIIHSINDVKDPSLLTVQQRNDLYGFWKYCEPIN